MGLLGLGYPVEYGGTPADVWFQWIVGEEMARIGVGAVPATLLVHSIGLPPIINWGSAAMKEMVAP